MKKRQWKKKDDKWHDRMGVPRKLGHGTWKMKTSISLKDASGGVVLTIQG